MWYDRRWTDMVIDIRTKQKNLILFVRFGWFYEN